MMRARMDPFPGRSWDTVADHHTQTPGRVWWKLASLETFLATHREFDSVAWCDDDLRGGRPAAVRRRLDRLSVEVLLVTPRTSVGLTPVHVDRLTQWLAPTPQEGGTGD
jgi:hypothetical protein